MHPLLETEVGVFFEINNIGLSGEVFLYLVELEGVGDAVVAYLLASEGGEEGAAAESQSEVAGEGTYVGTLATVDAEVNLR